MDFVRRWSKKTEIGAGRFIRWIDITISKFYSWRERYGKVNEHNGWVSRDFSLEDWEKRAIIGFHLKNPLGKASKKGTCFEQPLAVHQHQRDFLLPVQHSGRLQPLHRELGSAGVDDRGGHRGTLERAKELHPEAKPRIISDNGPQFIAKDFKEFIRISGMTHVRTSPYYPQSNGKIERWHKSLKGECIRPGTPLSLDDARRLVEGCVEHYNNVRLNSAIGYITPNDMLAGR